MKKAFFCAFLGSIVLATGARAGELYSDTTIVKNRLEWAKVTSCSNAFARTLDSLVKGRQFSFNIRTSRMKPNDNPVNVDFAIYGNKKKFSATGSIQLQLTGPNECSGEYTYTTVVPGECRSMMNFKENGYVKSEWNEILSEQNGDGGGVDFSRFIFLENKTEPNLRLILNDVGIARCAITQIQTLDLKNQQ